MNLVRRLFNNFFWLSIGDFISRVVGFILIIWLSRHYSTDVYGQWSWAIGFTGIFAILADCGFSSVTIRELARDKNKTAQYVDHIIVLKVIMGLITFMLMAGIVNFLGKDASVIKLVYFLGIYTILNTFATFFQSIFRAHEKIYYETAIRLIQSLALIILIIGFVSWQDKVISISYAYIWSIIISIVLSLLFIWKYFSKFFLQIKWHLIKEIFKLSWPFALSSISVIIYYHIDLVMIGIFKVDSQVAFYNAAYNIIILFTSAMILVITAIFPLLSQLYKKSLDLFKIKIIDFFKLIYLFSYPIIFTVFFNAQLIIHLIYGDKFINDSPQILQILIWSVLILFNYTVFAIGLSAADQQKTYLKGVGLGALFNVLINLLIIPFYGVIGAAITTILTECVICTYMTIKFIKLTELKVPFKFFVKVSLAAIITFTVIYIGQILSINIILSTICGLFIYFILTIFILKIFENSLLALFKKVISN